MNRNLLIVITLLVSSLFAASCSPAGTQTNANTEASANAGAPAAKPPSLPEDVVRVSAERVEVAAGKTAQSEVRLAIKEGYHINANPPSQYQIATQLTVEPSEGITAGTPSYPSSITKKFSFSEQPLAVYEKEATIKVPLTAAISAAKGERALSARLRFQACDEQVCYPKRDLQLSIPLTVK